MIKGILTSCLFILMVLLIRRICKGHIKQWIQYSLWLLVAMKLIVFPVPWITSSFAIISPSVDASNEVTNENTNGITNENTNKITNESIKETVVNAPVNSTLVDSKDTLETTQNQTNRLTSEILFSARTLSILRQAAISIWAIGSVAFALIFMAENLTLRMGLLRNRKKYKQNQVPIGVYSVNNLASPCLYGGNIYASLELLEDPVKRNHALTHEYCHYLHRDNIWSVVRCICIVAYWWNPLVWIAARCSKTDCEMACDEAVLKRIGENERLEYGRTLISLMPVKGSNYLVLASTMEGSKHSMKDRITFISKKQKTFVSLCVIAVALLAVALVFTCMKKPENILASDADTQKTSFETQADTQDGAQDDTQVDNQDDTQVDNQDDTQIDAQTEGESEIQEEYDYDLGIATDFSAEEVNSFLTDVTQMVAREDWVSLSEKIYYPIIIGERYFSSKEEFQAVDWSSLMPKSYINGIAEANLSDLIVNWQGIAICNGDLWIAEVDGQLYIIALNCGIVEDVQPTAGVQGHWILDGVMTENNFQNVEFLQDLFGTGVHAGANLDFNEDGTFTMKVFISAYFEGTYEITGDTAIIRYEDSEGNPQEFTLGTVEQDGVFYLVSECYGEKLYWKKLG